MYVRKRSKVAPLVEMLKGTRLSWCGHVMKSEETYMVRKVMYKNVEECKERGKTKKK